MSSISKSKEFWVKALLAGSLLAMPAPLLSQDALTGAKKSAMSWKARHPDVAFHESFYNEKLTKIQGMMNRSAPSIRYIVTQLQRRKMPLELMFVPLIESGYNPYAISPVGATGPWQLMPKTAQQYGVIKQDWYDGRKDLMASTRGALNYLNYLYNLFERDWLLALAAYNAGEGTVRSAMEQNSAKGRQTDFWSLSLPEETKKYVPKILALVRLYRDGKIKLPTVPEESRLIALHVKDGVSLAWLARQLGRTADELSFYNAGLENAVAPRGSRVVLMMPAGWGRRAHQVLGTGNSMQFMEKEPPALPLLIAERRALSDNELKSLGWGVGLVQKTPGSADLYSERTTTSQKSAPEKSKDQEKASQDIKPQWRAKIDPLSQWNQPKTEQPPRSGS